MTLQPLDLHTFTRVWIGRDMQFLMKLPTKTMKSSLLLCICWSIFSILNNLCRKVIPWINLGADTLDFHVALWASPLLWCWSRNAGSKWIHFPLSLPCWLHSLTVTTAPKWNSYYTLMHMSLRFVRHQNLMYFDLNECIPHPRPSYVC